MKNQLFESAGYFHVFNRGNNRENIFKCHDNYLYFLRLIDKYLLPICEIYCYCLLPNHFHLLIRIYDEKDLPKEIATGKVKLYQPFSNLFNAYAKAINKKYNRIGSLFQKTVKKIKISDDDYLRNTIVYIHRNPTHHSFGDFENYKYSSYKEIVESKKRFEIHCEMVRLFSDLENFIFVHIIP